MSTATAATIAPPVKHVVISGAAQGIGCCLTRHFLTKGHKVFILDINEDELKYTAEVHLKTFFSDKVLEYSLCNLRRIEDIRSAALKAAEFLDNRIDVLINNGGISRPYWTDGKTMGDFDTSSEWLGYVETNLTAPFHLSQAVLPYMKTSKGREIRKTQQGYATTKSGLIGLTHSMAVSLSGFGIRVNLIAPGRIRVAHECREGDESGKQWGIEADDAEKHAANRAGMPEDIDECAEWLIGAGFVTGQSITIDGGATMQK